MYSFVILGLLKLWTKGHSEHSPNSGLELAILLLNQAGICQTKFIFHAYFVLRISYTGPNDLGELN